MKYIKGIMSLKYILPITGLLFLSLAIATTYYKLTADNYMAKYELSEKNSADLKALLKGQSAAINEYKQESGRNHRELLIAIDEQNTTTRRQLRDEITNINRIEIPDNCSDINTFMIEYFRREQ